jgi:predicted Zn-dependent protease
MLKERFILCSLCLALLLSCSSKKTSDRYREGDNSGQEVDLTVEQEQKLTKEALAEMTKEYPEVKNKALQSYIERLGQKIVHANNLHNKPYTYHFTVVDTPTVNAFALPAGRIFMTVPIIAMAESEAEIAGVLGHEIGHVVARHTAERMYVAKKEQGKTWLFGGVGAVLGGAAGVFVGNKLCDPKDTQCRAKYALYGAGGGAAGGLLVQKYGFMKNSQEDELESDRVGFRYAVNAGYDKNHIGDFYSKLLAMEKEAKKGQNSFMAKVSDAMATHPPSGERVKQAQEMKQKISASGGIVSSPEFVEMKNIAKSLIPAKK